MSTAPQLSPLEQLGASGPQTPTAPAPSTDLSPLEQLGQSGQQQSAPQGAAIQPVTRSTNPKLAEAMPGANMPEYVGATGGLAAGTMGAAILEPAVSAAIAHLGGLTKIVQAAKALGWTTFGLKEAHDLYKMASGSNSKDGK